MINYPIKCLNCIFLFRSIEYPDELSCDIHQLTFLFFSCKLVILRIYSISYIQSGIFMFFVTACHEYKRQGSN